MKDQWVYPESCELAERNKGAWFTYLLSDAACELFHGCAMSYLTASRFL